jgi:hypothetical protein
MASPPISQRRMAAKRKVAAPYEIILRNIEAESTSDLRRHLLPNAYTWSAANSTEGFAEQLLGRGEGPSRTRDFPAQSQDDVEVGQGQHVSTILAGLWLTS